jgi:hypothetical protein
MIVGAFVLPRLIVGMTDASTTRRLLEPMGAEAASTTGLRAQQVGAPTADESTESRRFADVIDPPRGDCKRSRLQRAVQSRHIPYR